MRQGSTEPRREDDEESRHSSTQLILFLLLSVLLLTLPWVVDHPVTLLVPVAFLVLPVTSGVVRSFLAEGYDMLSSAMRWFARHRQQPVNGHGQAPHVPPPHPHPQQAYHPAGGFQQPHGPAYMAAHPHAQPMRSAGPLHPPPSPGRGPAPMSPPPAPYAYEWTHSHPHAQPHPHPPTPGQGMRGPMAQAGPAPLGPSCPLPHAASDFSTPDLDFDSESDMDAQPQPMHHYPPGGPRLANGAQYAYQARPQHLQRQPHPGHPHPHPPPPPLPPQQAYAPQSRSQSPQPGQAPQRGPLGMQQRGPLPGAGPTPGLEDAQHECTIRNWDDAECMHRPNHRPLAELLSNGQ
ncbi:hypothetical protein HYH03_018231 [Edaphochlamys debaryana]|uniref:Uncharacterized protein n=1 Tax=Edaphochlamys debaryana TaxID=47281 RepID=A0A835XHJ0_9CHLO|nr:hypothetical protein HYH03_018231 [Edaphochlamys debaryana]|eukprot:KAG2482888.1 hypothetical protein HYH03_018231 [Edaphochlamys debaryana]